MKQHMNRITALFLCLAMVIGVLGMLPGAVATASAAQTSAAAGVAPNLLEDLNYSFENGTEDWTFSNAPFYQVVNDEAWVGSSSLKVDTDGTARLIMSNFVDVSGISNLFLSFAQKGTGTTNLFVYYYNDDLDQLTTGGSEWLGGKEATSEWTPIYGSSKVPAGAAYAKLYISRTNDGEVWYDNAIIRDADLKAYAPELRETFDSNIFFDNVLLNGWEMRGNGTGNVRNFTTTVVDNRTVASVNTVAAGGPQSTYIDVSDYSKLRFSVDVKSTATVWMYCFLFDSNMTQKVNVNVSSGNGQKNNTWTSLINEVDTQGYPYARVFIQVDSNSSAYIDNVCIKGQAAAPGEGASIDFESEDVGGVAKLYADGWAISPNISSKGNGVSIANHPETGSKALQLDTAGFTASNTLYAYSPCIYVGTSTQVTVTFTSYGTSAAKCNVFNYTAYSGGTSGFLKDAQLDTTGTGTDHTITVNVTHGYPYILLQFVKNKDLTGATYIDNIKITGNAQQGGDDEEPEITEDAPLFLSDFENGTYKGWNNVGNIGQTSVADGVWTIPNVSGTNILAKTDVIKLNGSEKVLLSARYIGRTYFYFTAQFYSNEAGTAALGSAKGIGHLMTADDWTDWSQELTVPEGALSMVINFTKEYRSGIDSQLDYYRVDHIHTTTEVPEVPATTTAPGTEAYYTCGCGKLFADAEATEQITAPAVIPQLTLEISKYNINMGENLGLIFAVKRSDLTGTHAKYSAKATMPDGTTVIVPFTDWNGETIKEEGVDVDYKYFSVTGLAAKEMNDAVEAVILYNGEVVSPVSSLSVREYAEERLAKSTDEKFKAVCVDLLNYGAAAQIHFGYQTETLANSDIDAYQTLATPSVDLSAAKREIITDTTNSTKAIKTNVRFESDISLMVAIDGEISYTTGKITFTNHNGNEVVKTVSFANSKTTNIGGKGYRYMEFTGMVIADLNSEITVTVDQKIVMTYNLAQYVKEAMANGSETMKDLAEAFGKVSTSAYAYKHPQV